MKEPPKPDYTDKVFATVQAKMRKESISGEVRKGIFDDLFKESRERALKNAYHPKNDHQ